MLWKLQAILSILHYAPFDVINTEVLQRLLDSSQVAFQDYRNLMRSAKYGLEARHC